MESLSRKAKAGKPPIKIQVTPAAECSPPATAEELANLLKSYADLVESADKKSDKSQAELYKSKLRCLCSSYRIVSSGKKENPAPSQSIPQYQEKIKEWESDLKADIERQEEILERRLKTKSYAKDSPEAVLNTEATDSDPPIPLKTKRIKEISLLETPAAVSGVSAEVVIHNLEESVHKLNEDKAKAIARLVESIAREKYAEIVKIEEKYAKEIEKCKVSTSLFKAVLQKLNEKKECEIKAVTEKYAKKQADSINEAQAEFAIKLSELYEGVKKMAVSPINTGKSMGHFLLTPTHRGRFGGGKFFSSRTPSASNNKRFVFPPENPDISSPL